MANSRASRQASISSSQQRRGGESTTLGPCWSHQDTEIAALLGRLTDEIRRSSNDSLVGLYFYGSLVTGDFDKDRSDIDLLAVVDNDLDGDTFDRLDRMHARFVEDHPAWEDRIEVAYVPAPALWNFRTRTDQIAVISPGEPFHLKAAGKDWLINWYMVREVGVTLCGPPPRALIPEISQSEFVEAVREQAEAWKEWVYKMRTPGAQSYAVRRPPQAGQWPGLP